MNALEFKLPLVGLGTCYYEFSKENPVEELQVAATERPDDTVRHSRKIQGTLHVEFLVIALELVELASRHRQFRL